MQCTAEGDKLAVRECRGADVKGLGEPWIIGDAITISEFLPAA